MNLKRSHRQPARRLELLDTMMDSYMNWREHSRPVDESHQKMNRVKRRRPRGSLRPVPHRARPGRLHRPWLQAHPRAHSSDIAMETTRPRFVTAPVAVWRGFQRLTQLSFPRSYPVVQFPNLPLILAFASGMAAHYSHGQEHADFQAVSYLSMAVWAYLELFLGVNMFRRLLGLAYTISTVVHLAGALH